LAATRHVKHEVGAGRIVIEQMIAAGDLLLAAAPKYTQHTALTTLNFRSVAAESRGSELSPLTWRCGPRRGRRACLCSRTHDWLYDDAGVSQRLLGLGDRTTLQQALFGVGCCQQWPECHRSSDT